MKLTSRYNVIRDPESPCRIRRVLRVGPFRGAYVCQTILVLRLSQLSAVTISQELDLRAAPKFTAATLPRNYCYFIAVPPLARRRPRLRGSRAAPAGDSIK